MKIGIVDDGQAAALALQELVLHITLHDTTLLKPVYADMQPKATPEQIARAARGRLDLLSKRGADAFLVLIDLEDSAECPGKRALLIEKAFRKQGYGNAKVVIKKHTFENWLISDPQALSGLRGRFRVTEGFRKRVSPNKADNVADAEALLNSIAEKPAHYHKRNDATQIARKQDVLRVAANSRSFRRFLRLLNHPAYANQSLKPNKKAK